MRVAFVHDWLVTYRGGERVLEALLTLYPEAPVYTLFYDAGEMPDSIRQRRIYAPKWLKPFRKIRKALLPVLPFAIEALPLEDYDLVISTSSCVAKGVITAPEAQHLCYLHSPMRYIWDQRRHYLEKPGKIPGVKALIHLASTWLRLWDGASSQRVDRFVVNSSFIARRVNKYYGKEAVVIHPPVDTAAFSGQASTTGEKAPFFLAAGAFVNYKRLDLAIRACQQAGKDLVVAGSGPEEALLRNLAGQAKGVRLIVAPDQAEWVRLMQEADAFIFPAKEDFGITAIEAMAAGTPVIAYRGGGALDFIRPGVNGEFFDTQDPESLAAVLQDFRKDRYPVSELIAFSQKFSTGHFTEAIRSEIQRLTEAAP